MYSVCYARFVQRRLIWIFWLIVWQTDVRKQHSFHFEWTTGSTLWTSLNHTSKFIAYMNLSLRYLQCEMKKFNFLSKINSRNLHSSATGMVSPSIFNSGSVCEIWRWKKCIQSFMFLKTGIHLTNFWILLRQGWSRRLIEFIFFER